jgi:site-specific DNA recombinase
LIPTVNAIEQRGFRTKLWVTKAGKTIGGIRFNKNSLHLLLTNRIYVGKVTYHDEVYEGEHDAIVDEAIFNNVHRKLRGNRINAGDRLHGTSAGVLAGLLHCTACSCLMTHSSSGGPSKPRRYRYYVCNSAAKRGRKTCPRPSLPAEEVEQFVVAQLRSLTIDENLLNDTCHRVRRSIGQQQHDLHDESSKLFLELRQAERAIDALSTPLGTQRAARQLPAPPVRRSHRGPRSLPEKPPS